MIIPITLNTPSSSTHSNSTPKLPSGLAKISNDEIVLIELQGFLDVEASTPEQRNGKFIGKLKVDDTGKPSLVIGHHLLEGKIATLAKPLAIFHRVGGPVPHIASSSSGSSSTSTASSGNAKVNGDDTPRKRRRTNRQTDDGSADEDGMNIDIDIDTEPATALSKSLQSSTLSDDNYEETQLQDEGTSPSSASWVIMGLVKKKIIFSKRPMPISAPGKK